jgi:serine protease
VVAQLAKLPGEGSYRFEFTAVAAGDYLIAAGSDIDGNGFICDPGEACGRFPAADYSSSLQVDKNLSGLDFVASYGSGIRESGAENSQARAPSPGPLRLLRPSPPGK